MGKQLMVLKVVGISVIAASLAACGGGDSGGSAAAGGVGLVGFVGAAPIADAVVTVCGANSSATSACVSTTTNVSGNYTLTAAQRATLTAPYFIKAVAPDNTTLYSVLASSTATTVNVSPLTTMVALQVAASLGSSVGALTAAAPAGTVLNAAGASVPGTLLASAVTSIATLLQPVATAASTTLVGVDFMNGAITAGSSAADIVAAQINVTFAGNTTTVTSKGGAAVTAITYPVVAATPTSAASATAITASATAAVPASSTVTAPPIIADSKIIGDFAAYIQTVFRGTNTAGGDSTYINCAGTNVSGVAVTDLFNCGTTVSLNSAFRTLAASALATGSTVAISVPKVATAGSGLSATSGVQNTVDATLFFKNGSSTGFAFCRVNVRNSTPRTPVAPTGTWKINSFNRL